MKKIIALFVFLSVPSITSAQVWLTAGYGSSWLNTSGADFVIDQYNDNRDYLTTELGKPGAFRGMGLNFGLNFVNIQMDARYSFRSTNLMADGVFNGTEFERTVDFKLNSFGFGFGVGAFEEVIGFGAGVTLEITRPKITTQVTGSDEMKVDMGLFATAASPHLIIPVGFGEEIPFGFTIRPYYTFGITEIDYSDFNETINPATFGGDPTGDQSSRIRGFGIEIQLGLVADLGF